MTGHVRKSKCVQHAPAPGDSREKSKSFGTDLKVSGRRYIPGGTQLGHLGSEKKELKFMHFPPFPFLSPSLEGRLHGDPCLGEHSPGGLPAGRVG
jgi:hypothetical protein